MKAFFLSVVLLCSVCYGFAADPMRSPEPLADALRRQVAMSGAIQIRALVVAADSRGSALLSLSGEVTRVVRTGDSFDLPVEGVSVPFSVLQISTEGVTLDAPTLPEKKILIKSPFPLHAAASAQNAAADTAESSEKTEKLLALFEANDVPLQEMMRLLSSVTGENVVVSPAASSLPVRIQLSNLSASKAIALTCSALGIWYRPDPVSGVPTIVTMEEYEKSLASFREEQTETFTLLYPNVIEVASVLYGLYPDRVFLTLGEEDILDDEKNDLARRFERFKMIDDAVGSSFSGGMSIQSVSAGSASSNWELTKNDRYRNLKTQQEATYRGMSSSEAQALEEARAGGDTAQADALLRAHRDRVPSIFVTVSRRNNLVIVRTGDAKAMADISALIRRLDVPTPTVLLEMKVMEFSLSDDFESTFEYEFAQDIRGSRVNAGFPGFTPLANTPRTDMFSFQLLSDHFNTRIQLLQEQGKAKTIATPTLLVANNEVSRLFIGQEVPITTGVSLEPVSSTTANGVTSVSGYTVEPETSIRSIGTTLLVTPSINADHTLTLHMIQEESSVIPNGGSIPYGDAATLQSFAVDTVESRRVSGTFIAMDDRITAIGGLIRERDAKRVSKVPVLGSIPLLGFLFRSTVVEKTRSELVVFVRPHIFSTPVEGEEKSRILLQRLSKNPALPKLYENKSEAPKGL